MGDPKIERQLIKTFEKNFLLETITEIFLENYYDPLKTEDFPNENTGIVSHSKRPEINPAFDEDFSGELNDSDFEEVSQVTSQVDSKLTVNNKNMSPKDNFNVLSYFVNDVSNVFDHILVKVISKCLERKFMENWLYNESPIKNISIEFEDVLEVLKND